MKLKNIWKNINWKKIKKVLTYSPIKGSRKKKILYRIWFLLFIYLILIIFAKRIETHFTFPWVSYNTLENSWYIKNELDFEEINIKTEDWENINGLYVDWKSDKTIYYFHGNWGSLPFFYSEIIYLRDLWYNVISYDFPWYGKSTGYPYEDVVYKFSETFYEYMKKEKELKDENVIVWWYSIWTAVATDFVFKNPSVSRLVLVAPLASRYDMSEKVFWFVVQKFLLLRNSFTSFEKVRFIDVPTLIIHWNNDKVISFEQWKKVFSNSIAEEKYFIELDNFGHNYIIHAYWEVLKSRILDFLWNEKEDKEIEVEVDEKLDEGNYSTDEWENIDNNKTYYFIDSEEKEKLIKNLLNKDSIKSYDMKTDSSITKFVNSKVSFNKLWYVPNDLEEIDSEYIDDTKWWQTVRSVANENLQRLAKDFYRKFWTKLKIVSAYRSYSYQKGIKDRGCPDNLCAKAWFSEHQSWLAVDIWEASTNQEWKSDKTLSMYFDWLNENAYKYGFHNTYQKWLDVDWYEIEPWHWRYLWAELALYLKDEGITFAEFHNRD